ncbi:MAG: hypothetical protein BWY98_00565 [Tenericutes bacterium ADurb.BinA155]|jgi:hypothetical protein|nr:MAG: hypothetical protein BWY98_00565 [Tenericutes bacterium ADurb.BinA155]
MALIKCPECGQMVSDKADVCIHCGYPLHDKSAKQKVIIIRESGNSMWSAQASIDGNPVGNVDVGQKLEIQLLPGVHSYQFGYPVNKQSYNNPTVRNCSGQFEIKDVSKTTTIHFRVGGLFTLSYECISVEEK